MKLPKKYKKNKIPKQNQKKVVLKTLLSVFCCCFLYLPLFGQGIAAVPFSVGERLEYSLSFNFIEAGNSFMEVVAIDTIGIFPCYHIISQTNSQGFLDKIHKVRDFMETWIDMDDLSTRKFSKKVREGRYKKDYSVSFDYSDSLAYSNTDTLLITEKIHDALSVFYYVRNIDLQLGQIVDLNNWDNDKFKKFKMIVHSQRNVKVPAGRMRCYVVEPYVDEGELFTKYKNKITMYISTDAGRLPVMIESKATFGKMILKLKSIKKK